MPLRGDLRSAGNMVPTSLERDQSLLLLRPGGVFSLEQGGVSAAPARYFNFLGLQISPFFFTLAPHFLHLNLASSSGVFDFPFRQPMTVPPICWTALCISLLPRVYGGRESLGRVRNHSLKISPPPPICLSKQPVAHRLNGVAGVVRFWRMRSGGAWRLAAVFLSFRELSADGL
jgi:hypothetical protein